MEYVTVEGDVYLLSKAFVRYLQNESQLAEKLDETATSSKIWVEGQRIHVAYTRDDGEFKHDSYNLQEYAEEYPDEWREVFEKAGISPVDERILSLSRSLPGRVELESWR